MRTPVEAEAAWAAAESDAIVQAGFAKTAPTVLLDEHAPTGLSDRWPEPIAHNHQHVLLNNDQAG